MNMVLALCLVSSKFGAVATSSSTIILPADHVRIVAAQHCGCHREALYYNFHMFCLGHKISPDISAGTISADALRIIQVPDEAEGLLAST